MFKFFLKQVLLLLLASSFAYSAIEPNLTGKGVNVGIICRSQTYSGRQPNNDYLPDLGHKSFEQIKAKFYDDGKMPASACPHTTAIAPILAASGGDANSAITAGLCPQASFGFYEFRYFLQEYIFSGKLPGEDILTISLGWAMEDWWSRGIEQLAERYGLLVIAAIGNGQEAKDLPLYPAAGSNILAVGVADSAGGLKFVDPRRSTGGPASDGRCKPDIVAGGNFLTAAFGTEEGISASGDYSSFAAPAVAGIAALLFEKAQSEPNLQIAAFPVFSNCVFKSILMSGAEKLDGWHKGYAGSEDDSEYPLDFLQGAGLVNGLNSYLILTGGMQRGDVKDTGWDIGIFEPNYAYRETYRFKTSGRPQQLSAVLVWNRAYRYEYPFEPLYEDWADLRLELWSRPVGGRRTLIDYSDSPVDNVEHIYKTLEADVEYEIVVLYSPSAELPKTFTPYGLSWQTR